MVDLKVKKILEKLPPKVDLVAAVKDRTIQEIEEAISGGVKIIGENYLKQAKKNYQMIGAKVKWHFIGHLQTNKVRKAVKIFDMIETLDSLRLAEVLNFECRRIKKKMPVLIEINSAGEQQKYGVFPEDAVDFMEKIVNFDNLEIMGLMTMGPFSANCQEARFYFRKTKLLFDRIKNIYPDRPNWKYLSMGMSSTYQIALEEGANIVRIGTALFGPRN